MEHVKFWLAVFFCTALSCAAAALTYIATSLIIKKNLAPHDSPNERSSHKGLAMRGGGLSFMGVFAAFLIIMAVLSFVIRPSSPGHALWLALLGVIPIAAAGWYDDKFSLSPRVRLAIQAMCVLWALFQLFRLDGIGGLEGLYSLGFGGFSVKLGYLGYPVAFIAILWCVNLYNFMDGTDGFASAQGVTMSIFGGIISAVLGVPYVAFGCFILAGALMGFVAWNWPPAKIFMGDVGSCPLGFIFGVFAVFSQSAGVPIAVWLILGGIFFLDATATLILRLRKGHSPTQAHREHAYQRLVKYKYSHRQILLAAIAFNVINGIALIYVRGWQLTALFGVSFSLLFAYWYWTRGLPQVTDGTVKK